ncbi:MAG: hypothetical protein O7F15_09165, partial [Gammaproteobacteria bacterium]|nr:hypothetical protein [Gammaproteobacteria bacterium]
MAGYRKLLIVSPIVLVAIVIALYSQQLVDFNPKQNQPVTVVPRAERAIQNQTSSQNIPPANSNREVQSAIEDQLITQDSQIITPAIENITL